jgi:hypothetical protein
MTIAVSLTESAVFTALGNFLTAILPSTVAIVQAQNNRVPEPSVPDFVTMTMLRRPRLGTNIDTTADAKFTGSIAGSVMTITNVGTGSLIVGSTIFGVGVANNTTVQSFGTGTGGVGTYNVSPAQNVSATTLSAGALSIEQATEVVTQLDVHGPHSGDNAQIISTLFRDDYGVRQFAGTGVSPLYVDPPRQMPFFDAEQQYESRWIVDVHMQIDPVILVPQQYADAAVIGIVDVTAAFPS